MARVHVLCVGLVLLCASLADAGAAFLAPAKPREAALQEDFRAMMADDGDDDDLGGDARGGSLLQSGTDRGMSAYMAESEQGLNAALGSRWQGQQLEKDANEKTHKFLEGIASPKALGGLQRMLSTMAALR